MFAHDINKLQGELLNDHIEGLRTQVNAITIADLQSKVEELLDRLFGMPSRQKSSFLHEHGL